VNYYSPTEGPQILLPQEAPVRELSNRSAAKRVRRTPLKARVFLFATNGGDNSVSRFAVGDQGRLKRIDTKPTGNAVEGKSGTAKSLAYLPSKGMLFVLHSFGPDHLRLMSVDAAGKLTPRMERYTANTHGKTDRVPTMAVLSPDGKFLIVGTTSSSEQPASQQRSTMAGRLDGVSGR
jgi:hypothetical protein